MQTEVTKKTDGANKLTQLWVKHIVYWPFYLLLLVLSFGAAWLYLQYKLPVYRAVARMLIKDERKGTDNSEAMDFLNKINTKKVLENEIEVITSKSLLEDVVKDLDLYAPVYEKDKFRTISAYTSSPVKIEVKNPDALQMKDKTEFVYDKNKKSVTVNGKVYPVNQWVAWEKDSLRFVNNNNYNGAQKQYYFKLFKPGIIANTIKANLKVWTNNKQSSILNLEVRNEVPEYAIDVLNELMVAYNNANQHDKNVLAQNTLAFVQKRITDVKHNLDSVERKTQQFKASQSAVNIGTQGDLYLQNVSQNDQKLSDINTQLAVLNKVEGYVMGKEGKGGIVPSTLGLNDPILSQLLNTLYKSELEYEQLKSTEAQNSPTLTAVTNQIQKIRPGILENIKNQRQTLLASKTNLSNTNSLYSSALRAIPQKEKALIDINREQEIISNLYTFLLQKREESALSYASTIPNSTIIDKAESTFIPISPKPQIIYLIAFLFPLCAGVTALTIREKFNTRVMFRQEIEDTTLYPVIGEIAADKTNNPVVINKNSKTFIAEQFRQLRVALNLNKARTLTKRILVTSTISSEGKSFVALNLANTFALNGKKTVLLELDLNNPTICKRINISSQKGLSDYLLGKCDAEEIIKHTDLHENLFVIPAGPHPDSHPSELLENGRIQELLDYLSCIFDHIIIDTAPVSAITDAYVLSSVCDVTLYVIRHNYTPKIFIERLDESSKGVQLNNVAIVFNGIRPRGFGKHHYGYGYGYGYVYNEEPKKLERV